MRAPPVTAYVGLGANLGDPAQALRAAFDALAHLEDTQLTARSSLYRSAPVGYAQQPPFVNAVARISTHLEPGRLLALLLDTESQAGRVRTFANAPRTLDLDLLLYGDEVIRTPGLSVPHPRLRERRFALEPLVEIAPDCRIPGLGLARDSLSRVMDQSVERLP